MFGEHFFTLKRTNIDKTADVIFVADLFVEDYVGGAELTSEALISSSPLKVQKIKSKEVTMDLLREGSEKFWIFGNYAELNPQLIPSIIGNLRYCNLEYDYKYCKFRSPEKHAAATGTACDCPEQMNGKLVSAFYYGSQCLFWMSDAQKEKYHTNFPFLAEKDNYTLSSVFDKVSLAYIKQLRESTDPSSRKGWIVLGSNSWVKGFEAAEKWCKDNAKTYEVVWNLPYNELLLKLSTAEGFVYLPAGADTCPRMVIEAKLLGCKLELNENVQHKDEEWFATDVIEDIEDYLHVSPELFWTTVKKIANYKPRISGYTTTYNCTQQDYPFVQCIESMLEFCDEVCVVDGGSTDGTLESLLKLSFAHSEHLKDVPTTGDYFNNCLQSLITHGTTRVMSGGLGPFDSKIHIKVIPRDWSHPRHAVYDGMQKAEARAMCTGDFCWQMDSDEIVHEDDAKKIISLAQKLPKQVDILSLPVIEYWGGPNKIRVDIQPWKWRLSRNKPYITHGIPVELRATDADGNMYAHEGTDGCDMIHAETGERLPHMSFYTHEVENVRLQALMGNAEALIKYEQWFNAAVDQLPGVHHYSWYDLERKIKLYKNYWTRHWNSLHGRNADDTAENNMMFDVPWSEVTDDMIKDRAKELAEKTGGHIWHKKWTGFSTPHMTVNRPEPKVMKK